MSPRDLAAWAATTHGATQASAAVLVAAAIVCGVASLWFRADDRVNPPACYGLGWGCELDPSASLVFLVVLFVGPAVVVAVAVVVAWPGG